MTEQDIRGIGLSLIELARQEVTKANGHEPNADLLIGGLGSVLTQAFVDLNRIANALEQIALNGHPRSL